MIEHITKPPKQKYRDHNLNVNINSCVKECRFCGKHFMSFHLNKYTFFPFVICIFDISNAYSDINGSDKIGIKSLRQ